MSASDPREPFGLRTDEWLLLKIQQPESRFRLDALTERALCGVLAPEYDPGLAESAGMFLGSAAQLALLSGE